MNVLWLLTFRCIDREKTYLQDGGLLYLLGAGHLGSGMLGCGSEEQPRVPLLWAHEHCGWGGVRGGVVGPLGLAVRLPWPSSRLRVTSCPPFGSIIPTWRQCSGIGRPWSSRTPVRGQSLIRSSRAKPSFSRLDPCQSNRSLFLSVFKGTSDARRKVLGEWKRWNMVGIGPADLL